MMRSLSNCYKKYNRQLNTSRICPEWYIEDVIYGWGIKISEDEAKYIRQCAQLITDVDYSNFHHYEKNHNDEAIKRVCQHFGHTMDYLRLDNHELIFFDNHVQQFQVIFSNPIIDEINLQNNLGISCNPIMNIQTAKDVFNYNFYSVAQETEKRDVSKIEKILDDISLNCEKDRIKLYLLGQLDDLYE